MLRFLCGVAYEGRKILKMFFFFALSTYEFRSTMYQPCQTSTTKSAVKWLKKRTHCNPWFRILIHCILIKLISRNTKPLVTHKRKKTFIAPAINSQKTCLCFLQPARQQRHENEWPYKFRGRYTSNFILSRNARVTICSQWPHGREENGNEQVWIRKIPGTTNSFQNMAMLFNLNSVPAKVQWDFWLVNHFLWSSKYWFNYFK